MGIELNGANDIVRRNGNLPDEVLATKARPTFTLEEIAYLNGLPPQSKLKQAYLDSTAATELSAYEIGQLRGAGIPTLLSQSAIAIPHTGTTTATQLLSIIIPGGSLGPNGGYRMTLQTSETNNANSKSLIVRMSGFAFYQAGDSNKTGRILQFNGWNRGAIGSQLHGMTGVGSTFGPLAGTQVTTSLNTAVDQTLQVIVSLANAADTFTVEAYRVETWYGA